MGGYNLSQWSEGFEMSGGEADLSRDTLESNNTVLLPGRFYVLKYKAETDKPYNTRPVIVSLGLSKKDPESFLCIDLCVIPKGVRIRFVQKIFDMFENEISDNMERCWNVADADKQKQIMKFSYELLEKATFFRPFKNAVKRYKIRNTFRIYSVPFSGVYKIVGKFCDRNCFINTDIKTEQAAFMKKANNMKA